MQRDCMFFLVVQCVLHGSMENYGYNSLLYRYVMFLRMPCIYTLKSKLTLIYDFQYTYIIIIVCYVLWSSAVVITRCEQE